MESKIIEITEIVDDIPYRRYIGTAEDLSSMVKGWAIDLMTINPYENRRSFYDNEFIDALDMACTLDDIWLDGFTGLYCLSYVDGGDPVGHIEKLERKEID